jgi:hypothetical protein
MLGKEAMRSDRINAFLLRNLLTSLRRKAQRGDFYCEAELS